MIIRWNYESPLYLDETIASLTKKMNEDRTDFDDVPEEKWNQIATIWMESNPGYEVAGGVIDSVIELQKKAALKLIDEYSVTWERSYNVA